MPSLKPITPKPNFNPSRIKSSIPKQSEHMKQVSEAKKRREEKNAAYIEELKVVEMKRAVTMEEEHNITSQVLGKLRDNPNCELYKLNNEVSLLGRKIEPLLRRVEQATDTIKLAGHHKSLSQVPGGVSVLSKMGGRLISFYADDLAELLFEDFLHETVIDL